MWNIDELDEKSEFSEDIDFNEFELDPQYAKGLIDAVLDCFSDTASEHVAWEQFKELSPEEILLIPNFELEDILGTFDYDKKGNMMFVRRGTVLKPVLMDKTKHLVNKKGYLVDGDGNVVNRSGVVIFKRE